MKQEQLIEYILLRQSGELSTEQSAELQQMLDTNAEAAKLAKEYDNIYQAACEATPSASHWARSSNTSGSEWPKNRPPMISPERERTGTAR